MHRKLHVIKSTADLIMPTRVTAEDVDELWLIGTTPNVCDMIWRQSTPTHTGSSGTLTSTSPAHFIAAKYCEKFRLMRPMSLFTGSIQRSFTVAVSLRCCTSSSSWRATSAVSRSIRCRRASKSLITYKHQWQINSSPWFYKTGTSNPIQSRCACNASVLSSPFFLQCTMLQVKFHYFVLCLDLHIAKNSCILVAVILSN